MFKAKGTRMARTLVPALVLAALAASSPARAQLAPPAPDTSWAERMMDRPRQLGLEAELNTLETRLRTEQNLAALRAQGPPPPRLDPSGLDLTPAPDRIQAWPTIPDAALAASRARIEALLAERR